MMKNLIFLLCLFLSANIYAQQTGSDSLKAAYISFEKVQHDFGDVVQGEKVNVTFTFRNGGADTLRITDVRTTCGCTVPEWDAARVYLPGEKGEIKVVLNTEGKSSLYNKAFYVFSNARNSMVRITLRANILAKQQ